MSNNITPEPEKHATQNDFSGIWKRDTFNEKILSTAQGLQENKGAAGEHKNKKTWGVSSFLFSLLAFFILQILLIIPFISSLNNLTGNETPEELLAAYSSPAYILLTSLSMYAVWVGSMALTTWFRGERSFVKDFKLSFKKWDIFIGLGIAAGLYGVLFGTQYVLTEIFKIDLTGADNGAIIADQQGIWFFIIAILLASFLGPFCEELYFRGFFLRSILKTIQNKKDNITRMGLDKYSAPISYRLVMFFDKIKNPLTVILTSLLFGLFHFQGTLNFGGIFVIVVTGVLGSVFAIVTLITGRLGPAIFGHMIYNFSTLMLSTVFGG